MIKLAVIGANEPLIPFYKQAKALGYYIIGIAWAEGAVCSKYCDKFYPISFKDKEKVLDICRNEKIDGITSFSLESALPTVVYVAQHLGLVSNDYECVERTKNKFTQRETFKKNGIPVPFYQIVKAIDEIDVQRIHFPLIVKPVDSGGSQGITYLNDSDELVEAIEKAKNCSRSGQAIIESFIDGREFSVETLSYQGKHYILQITDKVTSGVPHFIELQHHQPANISSELKCKIQQMVEKALTALNISNSPSHTEIKLNTNGDLYIIEIGARMGGDFISSDLVRLSTGYDMVEGCIQLATGRFEKPCVDDHHFSGVYFYSSLAPDIVEVILNKDNYSEIIESQLENTELVEATSNADRSGYFIYTSDKGRFNVQR